MIKSIAWSVLAALLAAASPAAARTSERDPYYMCFAYTADGMLFAGGDFSFKRAQTMMAHNCSMPRGVTVVLLETLMVRRNGRTYRYARG